LTSIFLSGNANLRILPQRLAVGERIGQTLCQFGAKYGIKVDMKNLEISANENNPELRNDHP
jgi:hypothetical protein